MLLIYLYAAFLALVWVFLVSASFLKRRGKAPSGEGRGHFNPKVLVIVPCKGTDIALERGLTSMKNQDYGNFSMVAVADSLRDPSVPHIRKAGISYIARKRMHMGGSNKVMAILTAFERFKGYEIYVVADSDIVCARDWLSSLVKPLQDKEVGVSTAYPIFRPVRKAGFWATVKMVWGFAGDGLMEDERTRFAWGGSMAFRRDLLKGSTAQFCDAISDDIAITRIAKRKHLGISYVKERVIEVPSDDNFGTFAEWSTRQTAFSIRGSAGNFGRGIAYYSASAVLLYSAIALSVLYGPLFIPLLAPFCIRLAKAYLRAGGASAKVTAACLIMDVIYVVNLVLAKRKREVIWRGIRYSLKDV